MEKVQKWKYTKHLANEEKYSNNYSRKRDREKFISLIYYEAEVNLVLGLALEILSCFWVE